MPDCATVCASSLWNSSDGSGKTSLYVTHDQSEAMLMSDRIILMKDGEMVQSGTRGISMTARRAGSPRSSSATPTSLKARSSGPAGGGHALVALTTGVTIEGRFSWPEQSTDVRARFWSASGPRASAGDSAAKAAPNCFDAQVESVNFLGAVVNCLLQIGERRTSRRVARAKSAPCRRDHPRPHRARTP